MDVSKTVMRLERFNKDLLGGSTTIKRVWKKQMTSLANFGLLGNFLGMLTDSRSFLSYSRHEYFRRILCNLIGIWVENGEYPYDKENLTEIVKGISYNNAVRYFGFDL